jgi:putative ubiquitin-RnfH superfamily antitoxin RatB of RatAB toxin-antitoxin module
MLFRALISCELQEGASVSSVVRLRASVGRKSGLRMNGARVGFNMKTPEQKKKLDKNRFRVEMG